jgi:hypothetical protein
MREVLLADVALWGALITLAALIIIGRWRRSHSRIPARGVRGEAPELAAQKMAPPKTASVTRLGEDTKAPGRAAPRSAGPAPAALPGPTQTADPRVRPAPAAPPRPTLTADPRARPHRPGAQRDGQRPPARASTTPSERMASPSERAATPSERVTSPSEPVASPSERAASPSERAASPSEQVASYYDQADQPIADYLAALGWTQQPPHRPSGSRRRPG